MPISPFSAIEKNLLSEKIAAQVLSLIKERHLAPGEKLPPERELAAMLQVSRSSLREAFRALAVIGAVDTRQGDGTYVTALEPELLVDHLDYVVSLNESTFEHLFEARRVLEVGIVSFAAQRITDEEIARLEDCLERMEKLNGDYATFITADLEFHELIVKAARNPIYQSPYMASIRRLGRVSRTMSAPVPGLPEQSYADHQMILRALKAHDPDAAREAMIQHLDHIEAKLQTVSPKDLLIAPADSTSV